jgi:type IV pilus assembly protein PilC
MPIFEYEAMNAEGKAVVDTIEARNTDEVIAKVRQMNLFPTRVTETKGAEAARPGARRRIRKRAFVIGGVRGKQLTTFTRQLATLTDAGIPVVQALNILEHQMRASALKNVIGSVADEVEGGSSLSEAMAKFPKAFDELYCNMVKAGETSGMLDSVLTRLAEFREKAARLKRRVVGALIYPVAVLSVATLIIAGLIKWIIPTFIQMFEELDVELPRPTQILLLITHFCTKYWYLLPAVPITLIVLYKVIVSTRIGRLVMDWLKFKVPLFGTIMNKSAVARFTRTLGTLIGSGVPILEALTISRDTAGNRVLADAIQGVHDGVRQGDPIAAPLSQSKVCDDIVVNMVDVGEETGNLDAMLLKVADTYDQEVDVAVEGLTRLMEPITVVLLGGVIGFIVISLFMPLVALIKSLS